jgi:acylphosphatase
MAKKEAIEAIVFGNDEQVGFRALVMKQAIEYNLAGSAANDVNQVVHFTLQGNKKRIGSALATIRKGTPRSSDLKVMTTPTTIDRALKAFTIVDWTSSRRDITDEYNLVFKLRPDDKEISQKKGRGGVA